MKEGTKNAQGVELVEYRNDFTGWCLAPNSDFNRALVEAAETVTAVMCGQASLSIEVHPEGYCEVRFNTFEYDLQLAQDLTELVKYWIESREDRDGKISPSEHQEANTLIASFQNAATMLREAMKGKPAHED